MLFTGFISDRGGEQRVGVERTLKGYYDKSKLKTVFNYDIAGMYCGWQHQGETY